MSEKQVLFSRPLPIAVFIALALAADQLIKYLGRILSAVQ